MNNRQLFKDGLFLLERKYHCYKWELEGEAWWPFPYQEFQLFEFAETGGKRVEVMQLGKELIVSFQVHYCELERLQLKNTRVVFAKDGIILTIRILLKTKFNENNI